MKKLLLLLLITTFVQAQKIYPSYPSLPISEYDYLTQISYYDLNYVDGRLTKFLYEKMNMKNLAEKDIYNLNDGKGSIIKSFQEMASRGKQSTITLNYSVFVIEGDFVIKDFKVTGDYTKVAMFYLLFWDTKIHLEENQSVTNNFIQDRIIFNNDFKAPSITISNTTLNDTEKFISDFLKKKTTNIAQENNVISNSEEEKQEVKIVEEKPKPTPIIKTEKKVFKVKKKKDTFTFNDPIDETLKNKVIEYYKPFKDFNCTITATMTYYDNVLKENSIRFVSSDCN